MEISLYLAAIFVVFGLLFHGIGFRRGIKAGIKRERRAFRNAICISPGTVVIDGKEIELKHNPLTLDDAMALGFVQIAEIRTDV